MPLKRSSKFRNEPDNRDSGREVIGEDEAAAILGVSDRTLRKLRQSNQIPFGLVGGQIRYVRSTLIEWINAGGSKQKDSV